MTLKSGLEVTQGHLNRYHSKGRVRFPIRLHSNYGSILHHLLDKARYWSKIVIFSYRPCIRAPVGGGRRNIAIPFGVGKLEWRATRR